MAREVDDLFAGADAPRARLAVVAAWVAAGLFTAALGMGCSVLPGLGLMAMGLSVAEHDAQRLASGYYAPDQRGRVLMGRVLAGSALLLGFALLTVQMILLWQGAYHLWWSAVAEAVLAWIPDGPLAQP